MRRLCMSVLLLAALAFGQTWVVEQMDSTAASASPVELVKAADGRLWACYQTTSGVVRVACLGDSGWRMTDIRSASVPANVWRPFLAAGPHGELCLTCYNLDSAWLYRLVGDTWQGEPYPFMNQSLYGSVAYDTAGHLHTAFNPNVSDFWAGQETDSGWTSGLAVSLFISGWYFLDDACFTVAGDGSSWYFAYVFWQWSEHVWGEETALMHSSGDSWDTVWDISGGYSPIPVALVPHGDSVGYVSIGAGVMLYDSEAIDSISENSVAGLTYSAESTPLVTWVPRYSSAAPVFAFRTDRWRTENIPGPAGVGGIDIEVDTSGQVIIVYSTSDSGLWCARGTDVVGAKETPSAELRAPNSGPTILSGSSVQSLESKVIFDALGRRVVNPKPGVYFVRDGGRGAGDVGRTRKVVITR